MSGQLQKNNFDLLRILFAIIVFFVHSYELSGYQDLAWITDHFSSAVAVKAFFIVSGFLIFMSYERSSSLEQYFVKRIRRIYPAYAFVIFLFAFTLFAVSNLSYSEYFSEAWIKYVICNLIFMNFLEPNLPGVFEENPLASVNGALWTLKIEVMFYLTVPVFAFLFRRYGHLKVILSTYFCSFAYTQILSELAEVKNSPILEELARQLPGQLIYFMAGASFYYFRIYFERYLLQFLLIAILLVALNKTIPIPILEPLAFSTLIISLGLYCYIGNFGKFGDFSYGIYILHFPILQILISTQAFHESSFLFLGLSALLTFVGAFLLWNFVEKHCLYKRIYTGTE